MKFSFLILFFTISINAQDATSDKISLISNHLCECIESFGQKINERKVEKCIKKTFRKYKIGFDTSVKMLSKKDTIFSKAIALFDGINKISKSLTDNCPAYISFYRKHRKEKYISSVSSEVCEKLEINKEKNIPFEIFNISGYIFEVIETKEMETKEILFFNLDKNNTMFDFDNLEIDIRKHLSKKCKRYKKLERQLD